MKDAESSYETDEEPEHEKKAREAGNELRKARNAARLRNQERCNVRAQKSLNEAYSMFKGFLLSCSRRPGVSATLHLGAGVICDIIGLITQPNGSQAVQA